KSIAQLQQLHLGSPQDESTDFGCLISEQAAVSVERQVALTIEQGGKLVFGGTREGACYSPTIITDIPVTADVASNMEIFGPVVSIIPFDTEEEAIRIANASIYALS
ncbi:aldehyde dehydrogenase family protein, partial [Vibrio parahaemolyticus]